MPLRRGISKTYGGKIQTSGDTSPSSGEGQMRTGISVAHRAESHDSGDGSRLLWAKAKCAGAQVKVMELINQIAGDSSPTVVGLGQMCRGIRETHGGEVPLAEYTGQIFWGDRHAGAACP